MVCEHGSAEVIQKMVDGGFLTKENIVSVKDDEVSAVVILLSVSFQSVCFVKQILVIFLF